MEPTTNRAAIDFASNAAASAATSPPLQTTANPTPGVPRTAARAINERTIDFWLIGGASIVTWIALTLLNGLRGQYSVNHHFANIPAFAGLLVLFINYPHFMLSYKIAYSRGWRFIATHWFTLIFVPVALILLLGLGGLSYSDPSPLPNEWNPLRVRAGEGLVSIGVGFMYLTVGWHYIKQVFGCMMVYGSIDGYKLESRQRRILLWLLFSLAFVNLFHAQTGQASRSFLYGVPTFTYGLPVELFYASMAGFWILLALFMYSVVWRNWRDRGAKPSLHFLTPLVALLVWWLPIFYQAEYFFALVPMFHSLQYLTFARRYEAGRNAALGKPAWAGSVQVIILIATGYLAFELIPYFLNDRMPMGDAKTALFFVAAAHIFINVHHYFIDSVIWRFHQPEVRQYLMGRPA